MYFLIDSQPQLLNVNNMSLQWSTTSQHALDHGIKVCVHGRSGAGKTRLIATAPRPIIASAEAGTLSIASANIPMAVINSLKDLQEFYDWLRGSHNAKDFDTVCLDSITEIGEKLLTEEKSGTKDPRKAYGEMQDKITVVIRQFRDLSGKNVYFSAKTELREQPDGTKLYGPSMPGSKTSQGLPYFFDEFFALCVGEYDAPQPDGTTKKEQYRYLHTNQDSQYEAKDRSGALDLVEKADLNHIFTKIRTAFHVAPVQ